VTTELRTKNQAGQLYTSALSSAWRSNLWVGDPSIWLLREPELEEKMLRDADIAHAIGYRRHLISGRQWSLIADEPNDPNGPLACEVGTALLRKIKHFTQARYALARAFFSGSRFAKIEGKVMPLTIGDGKQRNWWVPIRLQDQDKRRYRISAKNENGNLTAHWQQWDVGRAEWRDVTNVEAMDIIRHVYQDDESTLGYGRGLREALGWWWYTKQHVFDESMQAAERHGQGGIVAKIQGLRDAATGMPNTEVAAKWLEQLEKMRSRHAMVMDADDQIESMPANGDGWQLLTELRAELKSSIFTLVLGANLTTGANEGGSYALAEVQENSTEALVQFDRETLEETLTDDLLGSVWWHNHANLAELGLLDSKPRFNIAQEKKTDPLQRAQVAEVANRMGLPLSKAELYEQMGFHPPEDGEDTLKPTIAQPGFAPGLGIGGFRK
jgi:hypothetical protein